MSNNWQICLDKYKEYSQDQIRLFKNLGDECPYLTFEDIDLNLLSSEEKDKLTKIDITSRPDVLSGVNDLLERFKIIKDREVKLEEAERKLCKIDSFIPEQETIDFRSFYFSYPGVSKSLSEKEFKWLYAHGYFPHLYWINNQPRFYKDMWFMVDQAIISVKNKTNLGIFSGFRDYNNLPTWQTMKLGIELTHYMYYSWKILDSVLKYSDRIVRAKGWKNEDFRIGRKNIEDDLAKNEARILADKLLSIHINLKPGLLKNFRDTFALYSYESFPIRHLIHLVDTVKWRTWFLTEVERQGLLQTFHPVEINTWSQKSKAEMYSLLSFWVEYALAKSEQRKPLGTEDIIEKYVRESPHEGKRPCSICGKSFSPHRKNQVTCGKLTCVNDNKNKSKRASYLAKLRPF